MRLPVARWQLNFSQNPTRAPEKSGFPVTKSLTEMLSFSELYIVKIRQKKRLLYCWQDTPSVLPVLLRNHD